MKGLKLLFLMFLSTMVSGSEINNTNRFASDVTDAFMKWLGETDFVADYEPRRRHSNLLELPEGFHDLFKAGQEIVGVSEKSRVPVKAYDEDHHDVLHYDTDKYATGVTTPDYVAINKNLLNVKFPYGAFRQVSLHESTHAKYNDSSLTFLLLDYSIAFTLAMIFIAILLFLLIFLSLVKKLFKIRIYLLILLCLSYISVCAAKNNILKIFDNKIFVWLDKYMEQRADINAFEHLDCYECAKEASYFLISPEERELDSGYLSSSRIKQFIKKYKAENRLCEVHKNIKEREEITIKKNDNFVKVKVLTFDIFSKNYI